MLVIAALIFGLMNGIFGAFALMAALERCPGGTDCDDLRYVAGMGLVILAICVGVLVRLGPAVWREWRG